VLCRTYRASLRTRNIVGEKNAGSLDGQLCLYFRSRGTLPYKTQPCSFFCHKCPWKCPLRALFLLRLSRILSPFPLGLAAVSSSFPCHFFYFFPDNPAGGQMEAVGRSPEKKRRAAQNEENARPKKDFAAQWVGRSVGRLPKRKHARPWTRTKARQDSERA